MQSSPPTRAWDRSGSPHSSEYSLNLNALDMEDLTADLDVPKQKVERIFSEDIDGPSDFTQNMDMWMRGGRTPKGTLKGSRKASKSSLVRPIQEDREEEDMEEVQTEDRRLAVPNNDPDDARTESHHTPENTPPKVSVLDDDTHHDDQFSSEWHTYDSASTPAPPVHRQFLQPTVEDYYSEFSPARQSSAHNTSRGRNLRSSALAHAQSGRSDRQTTPGRASSPTLSPVRSPIIQRSRSEHDDEHDKNQQEALEAELRQLQAKCQQLEHVNHALVKALEEEKRVRKQDKARHESQMTEMRRREKDLVDTKEIAHRHNEDFRREFGELKERLREQQRQAENAKIGRDESEQDLRLEVQRLREHLQVQGLEHHQEVKALEQDLELARRSRANAEDAAKEYREEAVEQRDALEADVSRLRLELQQANVDEAAITDLETQLAETNTQVKQLKAEKKDLEGALRSQREQSTRVKQSHEQDASRLTNERSRAVDLASGFQRQLQDLRRQLKEEQAAHEEKLTKLMSEQNKTSQISVKELDVIRAELESKQNELNEAILERDEAQDALESRQSNENALQTELDDIKAVNVALDASITDKLRKREQHWKEKLEEGDKERQLMAKALFHQWGREEVGIDSPQLYAYKYLSKTSPGKSPSKPKLKNAS